MGFAVEGKPLPVQNEAFEAESMAMDDGAGMAGWRERADTHETNAGSFSAEKTFLVGHTSARYYAPSLWTIFASTARR